MPRFALVLYSSLDAPHPPCLVPLRVPHWDLVGSLHNYLARYRGTRHFRCFRSVAASECLLVLFCLSRACAGFIPLRTVFPQLAISPVFAWRANSASLYPSPISIRYGVQSPCRWRCPRTTTTSETAADYG